jgi:hypothetical protein
VRRMAPEHRPPRRAPPAGAPSTPSTLEQLLRAEQPFRHPDAVAAFHRCRSRNRRSSPRRGRGRAKGSARRRVRPDQADVRLRRVFRAQPEDARDDSRARQIQHPQNPTRNCAAHAPRRHDGDDPRTRLRPTRVPRQGALVFSSAMTAALQATRGTRWMLDGTP